MHKPWMLSRNKVKMLHFSRRLAVAGFFFSLLSALAHAGTLAHLSGSYQVLGVTGVAPDTRVRLQFSLVNQGVKDLEIQRVALWSSSHPVPEFPASRTLVVRVGATGITTGEFLIPASDQRMWSRGVPLRLLVTVKDSSGRTTTEFVQLDRNSGGKAN